MKIAKLRQQTVFSAPQSQYNYFAWPSVTITKNGRVVAGAFGFRKRHICPYGKGLIAFSDDQGKTYGEYIPVFDTSLDDRDVGLLAFGESGLIVTSFNNVRAFQIEEAHKLTDPKEMAATLAHISEITREQELADLGSNYRISFDNGESFGQIFHSPITSPHGPIELSDGSILWLGAKFLGGDCPACAGDGIQCYRLDPKTGKMTFLSEIEALYDDGELFSFEPDAVQLPDGRIIAHIRAQGHNERWGADKFTTFQCCSDDMGKSWSKPFKLLGDRGGAPTHLLLLRDGTVVCTIGYRDKPFGINAMVSRDGCRSWSRVFELYNGGGISADLGYPMSAQLEDGSILTVFYCHETAAAPATVNQIIWRLEE